MKAFDALFDAYRRIGESIPMVSEIANVFSSNGIVKRVLGNVYEDILSFHRRAVSFFKQKGAMASLTYVLLQTNLGCFFKGGRYYGSLLIEALTICLVMLLEI